MVPIGKRKREPTLIRHDRLKFARERKGLTQAEVTTLTKLSGRQLSERENSDGVMQSDTLAALARVLEVSVDWLMGLTDDLHGHQQRALSDEENRLLVAFRDLDYDAGADLFDARLSAVLRNRFRKPSTTEGRRNPSS